MNLVHGLKKLYGESVEVGQNHYKQERPYKLWVGGDFFLYFKKNINFDYLASYFKSYNYDVSVECNDEHIYVKSKNSDDFLDTEYCVSDMEYTKDLVDMAKYLQEDNSEKKETMLFYLE